MALRMISLSVALMSIGATLPGCKTAGSMANLQNSVQGFNENLRWERLNGAASFLPPDARQKFINKYSNLRDDLFIQNLEVQTIEYLGGTNNQRTRVLLLAEYYVLPSTVVQHQTVTQYWEFIDGFWQLTDPGFTPVRPGETASRQVFP